MSFASDLLFHLLPPRCPLSGEVVENQGMLSPKAWESLNFIAAPFCNCCGVPLEVTIDMGDGAEESYLCGSCLAAPKTYHSSRAAVVYNDASRDLVLAFKHGDQTHLVLTFIPWLRRAGEEMLGDSDLIVPVPLHWKRLLKRRYNQAALIAARLAKETEIPYEPEILKRVRHTPVQGHLSARDRQANVRSAFELNKKYAANVRDRKIVLIDDVYTTGATVEECAATLYAAGASRVDVLTVARVSKPDTIS